MLVSANGPDSGVWSKHSGLGISTMRQVQRNKGREGVKAAEKRCLRSEGPDYERRFFTLYN